MYPLKVIWTTNDGVLVWAQIQMSKDHKKLNLTNQNKTMIFKKELPSPSSLSALLKMHRYKLLDEFNFPINSIQVIGR